MTLPSAILACPLDGSPLVRQTQAWLCAMGHSYDIAREGYVNLLPVQHKRSLDPGDSKAMVASRRRLLNDGYYQPIADAMSRRVLADLAPDSPATCLDAGCGEGYYLRQLAAAATRQKQPLSILGLDISKWAVLAAAKQDKGDTSATWIVGTNAKLPVQSGTVDRLLCMFGFPVYPEFARVLKPGGCLIQIDAGPNHLRELREIIYPSLKPERPASPEAPPGFIYQGTESVSYSLTLEGTEVIADLLSMTPHLYKATAEGKARAAALESIVLTVDAKVSLLARAK